MNPTPHPPGEDWEAWLDRQLRQLPDRPAPASLAPRVLAAVAARARRPWYRQPWFAWPRGAQVLALLVLSGALGSLTYALLHLEDFAAAETLAEQFAAWWAPVEAVRAAAHALVTTLSLLARQVSGTVWVALGGLAVLMYAACLALGTVLYRLCCPGRPQRMFHETR